MKVSRSLSYNRDRHRYYRHTGNIHTASHKVRKLREFEVVEQTYTDLTPLEDGRLLADIVERKTPEDEIDEEDYWEGYKIKYDNNMKIRNEKLDKLFQENRRFYARTNPEVSQTMSTQEEGVLSSNDNVDDIPF